VEFDGDGTERRMTSDSKRLKVKSAFGLRFWEFALGGSILVS
jgi:hypothetical protein